MNEMKNKPFTVSRARREGEAPGRGRGVRHWRVFAGRAGLGTLVVLGVAGGLLAGWPDGMTVASGTLSLPSTLAVQGKNATRADLLKGKALFSEKTLIGAKGKTCVECHNDPERLSKTSLASKKKPLVDLINACLTHPERGAGKALASDSSELFCLQAWLAYRYQLETERKSEEKQP